MSEKIDFTGCRRVMGKVYNGVNGKKIAVEYEGRQYMLKFPPPSGSKSTEFSCTNSCLSEHIASTIFNMLGVPAQKTVYMTYIGARISQILVPAYKMILSDEQALTKGSRSNG